jgi:hypothetical protein
VKLIALLAALTVGIMIDVDVALAEVFNFGPLQEVRGLGQLLRPWIGITEIVGFVAGFGTTFAAVPDLIAMLKRRSCGGMNPSMAAIMGPLRCCGCTAAS